MAFDVDRDGGGPLGPDDATSILDATRKHAGESMRGAVHYVGDDFDLLYVREDVDERYSTDEIEDIVGDIVLEAFGDGDRLEDLLHLGALESTVRWFEDGILVNIPYDARSGVILTFDHRISANLGTIVALGASRIDDS